MRKKLFWVSVWMCNIVPFFAQDMHFSQATNVPLLINPALCGQFDASSRAIITFRNQQIAVPNSSFSGVYNSIAASYETKIFKEFTDVNSLSIGILGTSDYAGTGTLATNDLLATINYKMALDRYGQSSLSIAGQVGVTSKRIFSNDLLFEAQASEFDFDPSLPNLETYLDGTSHIQPNLGLGTLYQQGLGYIARLQVGFSIFNINKPQDIFITSNSSLSTYSRINLHSGIAFDLDESMTLYPSIVYMKQGPATQFNLGMSFQKVLNDDLKLIGGLRSRLGDAFILIGGLNYRDFQATISYDATVSNLSKINKSVGAFEINLTYLLGEKEENYNSTKQYCPSF